MFGCKSHRGSVLLEQLKNLEIFNSVRIGGLSVEWVTGQDICPDELYHNSSLLN
ncbi:MAG: DUF2442 domain-containing protein [Clostridiales bacterium]|nr:DUF2442 domain-containing protein [Clostridiales bacterium]